MLDFMQCVTAAPRCYGAAGIPLELVLMASAEPFTVLVNPCSFNAGFSCSCRTT